jgi:hypothetical protein
VILFFTIKWTSKFSKVGIFVEKSKLFFLFAMPEAVGMLIFVVRIKKKSFEVKVK